MRGDGGSIPNATVTTSANEVRQTAVSVLPLRVGGHKKKSETVDNQYAGHSHMTNLAGDKVTTVHKPQLSLRKVS